MAKPTAGVVNLRVPDPVITPRVTRRFTRSGRARRRTVFDAVCRRCLIPMLGLPDQEAADEWVGRHRCPDDPSYRLTNHSYTSQSREDQGAIYGS